MIKETMGIPELVQLLRWMMILPGALVAWWTAIAVGLLYVALLERLCPPEFMLSGMCTAPWYSTAFEAGVIAGASLAAVLVMLTVILLAPMHKRVMAISAFSLGSTVAVYMGFTTNGWSAASAAIISGYFVQSWFRRRASTSSRWAG